jgi:palmitoyltransferase
MAQTSVPEQAQRRVAEGWIATLRRLFTRRAVALGYVAGQALVWHALVVIAWGLTPRPPTLDAGGGIWFAWLWLQLNSALLLVTFLQASLGDPGTVDPDWQRAIPLPPWAERGELGGATHCDKCDRLRPARAHHCRRIDACVLRMDHFCHFIGNTVGLHNHRPFLQFLALVTLNGAVDFCLLLWWQFADASGERANASWLVLLESVAAQMCCMAAVYMGITNGLQHGRLVVQGLTSVEEATLSFEWDRAEFIGIGALRTHQYDYGAKQNLASILGFCWLCWILPLPWSFVTRDDGCGYYWRRAPEETLRAMREHQQIIEESLDQEFREAGLMTAVGSSLGLLAPSDANYFE